ncbi:MAG: DedA family protein [Candidatus Gracilibacteria bacterium]|nr:DedA family protein [Candidatus Gracilibacteria bacterium]
MSNLIQELTNLFGNLDYNSIFFLMALESSIFPVPSEAVMIPAGYLARNGELNIFLVIITGTFGSLFGAIINYFILGQLIGKPFLLKYGKYFFISNKKYQKAEDLFLKNDKLYTFLGRLLPVIRHLISIPAGIFKMNFAYFAVITTLGAGLWCIILVIFGYYFGEGIVDIFHKYTSEINIVMLILLILGFIYFIKKKD